MKAIVIGAGIGGLTAAIALRRAGVEVDVFERAPGLAGRGGVTPPVPGAGLTLWANAILALRTLGLDDAVVQAGSVIERGRLLRADGKVLSDARVGEAARRLGASHVCIHRAELQSLLLRASRQAPHLAHECIGIEQDAHSVVARFVNGLEARADVLIGADGLRSVVREALHGDDPPRYAGYAAWRGVTPTALAVPDASSETWGRGKRFGLLPVGSRGAYWFATANVPEGGSDSPSGRKTDVLEAFTGWHAPVEAVIEATEAAAILRNDIYDRPPLRTWGQGRVTLLGDAAHPMTPNMGQGACQAIEDAVVLARHLEGASDPARALRSYESTRRKRTAQITRLSRTFGRMGQIENPILCALRDRLTAITPQGIALRQFGRFWRFAVP